MKVNDYFFEKLIFYFQLIKDEIDENDLLILLNDTDLSRSFDRHSKFNIDHCKLLIAAIAHVTIFLCA